MNNQIIKIFDAEIDTAMNLKNVLKICKTIENASINDGEDVEETTYTYVYVKKDITKTSTRSYEIIFHEGKLESVEWWDIQVIFSAVPIGDMRAIVS